MKYLGKLVLAGALSLLAISSPEAAIMHFNVDTVTHSESVEDLKTGSPVTISSSSTQVDGFEIDFEVDLFSAYNSAVTTQQKSDLGLDFYHDIFQVFDVTESSTYQEIDDAGKGLTPYSNELDFLGAHNFTTVNAAYPLVGLETIVWETGGIVTPLSTFHLRLGYTVVEFAFDNLSNTNKFMQFSRLLSFTFFANRPDPQLINFNNVTVDQLLKDLSGQTVTYDEYTVFHESEFNLNTNEHNFWQKETERFSGDALFTYQTANSGSTPVPEPGTLGLFAMPLLINVWLRKKASK